MPNRFSKAFTRRRSSGNVLQFDETPQTEKPSTSSFRVLDRPENTVQHTFEASPAPRFLRSDRRPRSYGDGSNASHRDSGHTNASHSTANTYASHRLSYSSTVPSSVGSHDAAPVPDPPLPKQPMHDSPDRDDAKPLPPQASRASFSIKSAGRAFSFGAKSNKSAEARQNRERAPTASSYASTAVAPKLDFGDPDIGTSDFSTMFGQRGHSPARDGIPPVPPLPHASSDPSNPNAPGGPPRRPSSPGAYSWTSNASQEKLMSSPRQNANPGESSHFLSQFGGDTDSQFILESLYGGGGFNGQEQTRPAQPQPPRHVPDRTLPRERGPPSTWSGSRGFMPGPARQSPLQSDSTAANGFAPVQLSAGRVPLDPNADEDSLFDAPRIRKPFRPLGRGSTMTKRTTRNKVMTPAEYEEAKKKSDLGIKEDDEQSSSSESENYEDDDETERNKALAKQRRRQEAQLTVYRQQMMKVTGEQPSDLPDPPHPRARMPLQRSSNSAPSMLGSLPFEGKDSQAQSTAGKSSDDEDEDEEVPLGVLQAHGFPNRGRPPTRLSNTPGADQRTYPSPALATRNEAAAGGGGNPNLPVFAKNLPQDPYVGASLVSPGRREAMGENVPPQSTSGGLPHGGLVGIIADEERARALRRGSPNSGGTYDPVPPTQLPMEVHEQMMKQQMMQQQMMMMQNGLPMIGQQPMSPGGQSQAEVNNQMMHMMQVQMHWMQQMMQMQMQGQGQGLTPPPMPGMPIGMPGQPNGFGMPQDMMMRPASQASLRGHQRDASGMSRGPTPSTFGGPGPASAQSIYGLQGPDPGYAASVAPSERSVVGQPSRYRPVTPSGGAAHNSRTSTMSATTVQGLGARASRSQSRLRNASTDDLRKSATPTLGSANGERTTIRALDKPKHGSAHLGGGGDDDDDDRAWADMAKRRDARKSKWQRAKKPEEQGTFVGQQEGGLEGLYYEG